MTDPNRQVGDPRPPYEVVMSEIPVADFIKRYDVTDHAVVETLRSHPSLCYLLGRVTEESQTTDDRPDGVMRPVYYLREGSGMFGLKSEEDAMRWKGMFNHSIGTARQVEYTFKRLKFIASHELHIFKSAGYDFSEFDTLSPELARDFMFVSHASRRGFDERNWHNLHDETHPDGSPGETTKGFFEKENAPAIFSELIRVEDHAAELAQIDGETGGFRNVVDGILTTCDWMYAQNPISLTDRFAGLRRSRPDIDPAVLDRLEICGNHFEATYKMAFGTELLDDLRATPLQYWELKVRQAYCSPSGLTLQEAFPKFVEQYPQVAE